MYLHKTDRLDRQHFLFATQGFYCVFLIKNILAVGLISKTHLMHVLVMMNFLQTKNNNIYSLRWQKRSILLLKNLFAHRPSLSTPSPVTAIKK